MAGPRGLRAAAAAALLALPAAAPAAEDPDPAAQGRRADDLLSALMRDEGNPDLLRRVVALREECLEAGNHRTAGLLAGQVVARRPASLYDRHRYVRVLLAQGLREKARRDLEELLREVPSDCAAYRMLANLLASTGDVRGAMEVHARHLREHAAEAEPLHARAVLALRELGDYPAAREAMRAMRAGAEAPGTAPRTAAFLKRSAADLEEEAADAERQAEALREHARRLDRWLVVAFAAALAALAAAFRSTRLR